MNYLYMFGCKAAFLGSIECVIGIVSLEFFEKLWQTKYRLDRIFCNSFYQ